MRLLASSGTAASQKTKSLWDVNFGLPELALERDGADATLRSYAYGAKRLSYSSAGQASYFHYDGLGSVTNVTSTVGAAQQVYRYEPFGADRNGVSPTGTQQKVTPVLECVEQIGSSYRAHWGYSNPNAYALSFPIGTANKFSPVPTDRGQPTYFRNGRFKDLFTADFASGVTLSWALDGTTVKATKRSTACTTTPAGDNRFKFAGQRYDAGTGLYDLRARQYDAATGRFNGLDPLPSRSRDPYVSSYVYVRNLPTMFVDPSGLGPVRPPEYDDCGDGGFFNELKCIRDYVADDPFEKAVWPLLEGGAAWRACLEGYRVGALAGFYGSLTGCIIVGGTFFVEGERTKRGIEGVEP